jgi:hypothetical protein
MTFTRSLGAVALIGLACGAQAADWPSGYTKCADERNTCAAGTSSTREVSYGAQNRWVFKTVTGAIACTNEAFGSDPVPTVTKACANAPATSVPSGYTKCADEYGTCSPGAASARMVAYGGRDKWVFKAVSGAVACSNQTFGSDPLPGVVKTCANGAATANPDVPSGYTKCATEGQSCAPAATGSPRQVAFGARGNWVYKSVSGDIACTLAAFGSDPAWGITKTCSNGPAAPGGPDPSARAFLKINGTQLELAGRPFRVHSGVGYGWMSDPLKMVQKAAEAKLNVIELVNFEDGNWRDINEVMSEKTGRRVDLIIAEAGKKGIKILLNFSNFYSNLVDDGYPPLVFDDRSIPYDWKRYLEFVANRVNTVSGEKYSTDPTIGLVSMVGEVNNPDPNFRDYGPNHTRAPFTTADLTNFFSSLLAKWRAMDPNHIVYSGGFSWIDYEGTGIDWRAIMRDPNNQIAAFEIYSDNDRNITTRNVAAFAKSLGKPWFLSAWSSCRRDQPNFPGDNSYLPSDTEMAAHARDMYELANGKLSDGFSGVGSSFWALGPKDGTGEYMHQTCDIGPQFPKTYSVIQEFSR